ncbi:MAG TPA: HAMP domain-containing sensor histidine kinase [Stellaceae bacterium]|nr:HAMP domain-containing sensor histidine kinase [Stellaceae bacterium]
MIETVLLNRPLFRPGSPLAFAAAFATTIIATLIRLALAPLLASVPFGGMPFAAAFCGVVISTFLCGSMVGAASVFLAVAETWAFILPSPMTILAPFQTTAFIVGALTVIGIITMMRAAAAKLRRINENLRLSEAQLVDASKAKSDFIARMSHELRTPLNAIIGFSEMIREAMIGPLDARYRGYGADIHNAGRHLQNIINDILDISKIEGGRLELRDEPVALEDMIESCRRIVAAMAEATGVTLSVEIAEALPLIRCDALRFRQILLNLMSNAVKFTQAGGHAIVSAAIDDDFAVITVADTGIGMREEDIAIALEPFRQVGGSAQDILTRRFAGTGLGLPLAKALVELHGGTLTIVSALDRGTTVCIRLPLERKIEAVAA